MICASTATTDKPTPYFIQADHLGTLRLITDSSNNVVWRNLPTTEPFGNSPVEDDPGNTGNHFVMPLAFPGQYRDQESGLNYNGFRDYNPATGGYRQSDPIGLSGGQWSTYQYVGANPLSRVDSLGLDTQLSFSVSATGILPLSPFGVPAVGGGGGMNFGISTNGTFAGTSFFVQAQANALPVAVGAFAGVGLNAGISHTDGPLVSGNESTAYGEIDAGWGAAAGLSTNLDACGRIIGGAGGPPIKIIPGAGFGIGFGVGKSWTSTGVSRTFGQMLSSAANWLTN